MMITFNLVRNALESKEFRDKVPELAALYNYYDTEKARLAATSRSCSACSMKGLVQKFSSAVTSNSDAAKKVKAYFKVSKLIVPIQTERGRSAVRYL